MSLETLLFPYQKEQLNWPQPGSKLLFLNAENHPALKNISIVHLQPRYDLAQPFIRTGHTVLADVTAEHEKQFDTVWILPGKNLLETQYFLAQALHASRDGAVIAAAAANDAGGKRLKELFIELGLNPAVESKHKARVAYAVLGTEWNRQKAALWIEHGKEQTIVDGTILSRPGLHSWNKIDDGSALLAQHLPTDLSGNVADFGCGWGYLSLHAAKTSPGIDHLTLVDVDIRAIDLAKRNLQHHVPALPLDTLWADLTPSNTQLGPFHAILLNPPFHEGTQASPTLGQAIIATAARSLAPAGRLYLVANRHLPYEKNLQADFSRVEVLTEEKGFKVLACRK